MKTQFLSFLGKFCGRDLPNGGKINSTHNQVYMWFHSDHSVNGDGFRLTWTSADPGDYHIAWWWMQDLFMEKGTTVHRILVSYLWIYYYSCIVVCGGDLRNSSHGYINSPGYPGNYPHNRDCTWTVQISPGNIILFTFGHLAMEHHSNCSYDYLEVSIADQRF